MQNTKQERIKVWINNIKGWLGIKGEIMRELKIFFKEDKTITLEVPQDNIVEIVNMIESVYSDNLGYEIKRPKEKVLKK